MLVTLMQERFYFDDDTVPRLETSMSLLLLLLLTSPA